MIVSNEIIYTRLIYGYRSGFKPVEACRQYALFFGELTIAELMGQNLFKNFILEMKTLKLNQDLEDNPSTTLWWQLARTLGNFLCTLS